MKRIAQRTAVLLTFVLFGCATTPQKSAMDDLSSNRQQMDRVRGQIDRTMYSLENLARAPAAEIKDAQNQYAANVKSLRKMSDELDDGAKTLRQRRIDYLTEWERAQQNVESPELKRASEQRRKEVVQSLTNLESSLISANRGVAPLVSDLEDIERVTANDPTPGGVSAVKKSTIVQAAQKHAATANRRLDVAASQFDRALASLSPQPGTRPASTAAAPSPPGAAGTTGAVGAAGSTGTAAMPPFSQADRNKSGAIERDEASQISGLDFKSADRNNDGKLSESEYEAVKKAAAAGGASSTGR